jgi:hypothetical protein
VSWPRWVAVAIAVVGMTVGGWQLSTAVSSAPTFAATITKAGQTQVVVHTRILKKTVKGRVVRLKSGVRVVLVPRVVIKNLRCHPTPRHHCTRRIIVPAHRVPIRPTSPVLAAVVVAAPLQPVTVYATVTEPAQTVTLPAQTVTQTQINTTTETDVVTVTVPLPPSG